MESNTARYVLVHMMLYAYLVAALHETEPPHRQWMVDAMELAYERAVAYIESSS